MATPTDMYMSASTSRGSTPFSIGTIGFGAIMADLKKIQGDNQYLPASKPYSLLITPQAYRAVFLTKERTR